MQNETFDRIWIVRMKFGKCIKVGATEQDVQRRLQYDYGSRDIHSIEPATIDDLLSVQGMGGFLPTEAKCRLHEYREKEVGKDA